MTPRRRVLVPALVVLACVSVAASVAKPTPGGDEPPAPEMTPEESKRLEDFVHRFQRGQKFFYQGRDEEAERMFRDLLAEQPDAGAVHHAIAFVHLHRKETAKALASFEEAARLSPEDGAIQRDCGLQLATAGRPADAIPRLEAARKLSPPDSETILAYGHCLRAVGRPEDSEKAYREALAADPDSVDARTVVASVVVERDPAEALKLTDPIPPQWPDVVHVRAKAKERLRKWREAADLWTRLTEVALPGADGVPSLREASEGLVRCGDAERATAAATKWAELDRKDGKPSFRASMCLAVAKAGTGDSTGALAALDAGAIPEKLPPKVQGHLILFRVHCRVVAGEGTKGFTTPGSSACELVTPADVEVMKGLRSARHLIGAPFESAAASRLLGMLSAAELEAAAKGEPGRSNDIEWIEALVATVEGDAERADKHRRRAAELSDPPGEHPGLLLRVAPPK